MLEIVLTEIELFNDEAQEFVTITKPLKVKLEHSLISVSKWESIWEIPFHPGPGQPKEKTREQIESYVRCMIIGELDPPIFRYFIAHHGAEIQRYIESPQTATKIFRNGKSSGARGGRTITSELIYYWMTIFKIPVEFEKWHLNRLLALIDVCNVEQKGGKKMSKSEILRQNRAINDARRQKYGSKG